MDDLARMSEVTNEQRAQWAREALDAFARQNGQSVDLPDGDTEVFSRTGASHGRPVSVEGGP